MLQFKAIITGDKTLTDTDLVCPHTAQNIYKNLSMVWHKTQQASEDGRNQTQTNINSNIMVNSFMLKL